MNRGSALVKRTVIYAVGNMGSKVLSYLMVLVYSYYILPEDLGYYDLILTTLSMVQPLILLQINDAVYRYLVDANKSRSSIIASGFRFIVCAALIAEGILVVLWLRFQFQYMVWISLLMLSTMAYIYMQDVVRGTGDSKLYAGIGLMNSFVMLLFEVVGLVFFDLGVLALIVSKVASNIVCVVFVIAVSRGTRDGLRSKPNREVQKALIRYSLPLVPNAISWWAVNSSNRYIILASLGTVHNGIFSMANKFPTVLTTLTSIFGLAWQESAIKEYRTPNRDAFFSDVFCKYYRVLFSLTICAIPATRLVMEWFAAAEYGEAWKYTGFLYLAASFSALCSFLGTGYQISKETRRSFTSTIVAAGTSIMLNILTIELLGLHASSMSTFLAYLLLFMIRMKHTRRYFMLKVMWLEFIALSAACLLMIFVTMRASTEMHAICLVGVGLLILLSMNYALVKQTLTKCLHWLHGMKRGDGI